MHALKVEGHRRLACQLLVMLVTGGCVGRPINEHQPYPRTMPSLATAPVDGECPDISRTYSSQAAQTWPEDITGERPTLQSLMTSVRGFRAGRRPGRRDSVHAEARTAPLRGIRGSDNSDGGSPGRETTIRKIAAHHEVQGSYVTTWKTPELAGGAGVCSSVATAVDRREQVPRLRGNVAELTLQRISSSNALAGLPRPGRQAIVRQASARR